MIERHFDLARLLQPCAPAIFFRQYWGQRPLLLLRRQIEYYAALFSMRNADAVLRLASLRYPDLQLLNKERQAVPLERFGRMQTASRHDSGVPEVSHLYGAYAQGGIIFVHALQKYWQTIAALCRNLEQSFTHPVNADLYLAHKDSPGFRPHFHTHDEFILQIAGRELWRLYDVMPLMSGNHRPQPLLQEELPPPEHENDLQPGDLLYIPRG